MGSRHKTISLFNLAKLDKSLKAQQEPRILKVARVEKDGNHLKCSFLLASGKEFYF